MKRLFDLVLVLGSAPFWLPLLLVLAVLVRVRVGVPVFFLQQRPGLHDVLKGDMSLVGPRPLLMEYLPRYTPEQARRHEVRPVAGRRIFGRRSEVSRVARLKILIRPSHHPDR